jgi:hypothetical protein
MRSISSLWKHGAPQGKFARAISRIGLRVSEAIPGHPPRQRPRDVAPRQVTATNDINPQNSRSERGVPPNEKIITPV